MFSYCTHKSCSLICIALHCWLWENKEGIHSLESRGSHIFWKLTDTYYELMHQDLKGTLGKWDLEAVPEMYANTSGLNLVDRGDTYLSEKRMKTKQEANEGHGYLPASYKLSSQLSIFRLLTVFRSRSKHLREMAWERVHPSPQFRGPSLWETTSTAWAWAC